MSDDSDLDDDFAPGTLTVDELLADLKRERRALLARAIRDLRETFAKVERDQELQGELMRRNLSISDGESRLH